MAGLFLRGRHCVWKAVERRKCFDSRFLMARQIFEESQGLDPWKCKVPLRLEAAGALQIQEHHYTLIEMYIDTQE